MSRNIWKAIAVSALTLSISLTFAQNSKPPKLEVASWKNAGQDGFKLDQAKGKVVLLAFLTGFC